jgi:hypothetical protein
MGSHAFFKGKAGNISASNTNLTARAIGAPGFAGRAAGGERTKDLAAAKAINMGKAPLAKTTGSSAYAKGPKI